MGIDHTTNATGRWEARSVPAEARVAPQDEADLARPYVGWWFNLPRRRCQALAVLRDRPTFRLWRTREGAERRASVCHQPAVSPHCRMKNSNRNVPTPTAITSQNAQLL